MSFWDRYLRRRDLEDDASKAEMREALRKCYELSRSGCFSHKRSERDKALSDINRITEKYK